MNQFSFQSIKQKQYYDEPLSQQPIQHQKQVQRTKLTKKSALNGFRLTNLVWLRPAEGRQKYQILVRYIDPEQAKTKREDGSYQKVIKFGQKGVEDYVDPPHNQYQKQRNINRLKINIDNPLHPNFYYINLLNGQSHNCRLSQMRNHQKETHTVILQLKAQNSSTEEKVATLCKQISDASPERSQQFTPCTFCQRNKQAPSQQNRNPQDSDSGKQNDRILIENEEEALQIVESQVID